MSETGEPSTTTTTTMPSWFGRATKTADDEAKKTYEQKIYLV